MNKTMITLAIACAFVEVGCSSVPTPVVPDGGNRQPANTQAKIDDYKARTAEEIANYNERTALSRQVESLNKQIAELKAYMVLLQMDKENKHPKTQAVSHTAAPVKRNAAPARALGNDGETIEVRDQSIVFRVTQPTGKTDFDVSPDLQAQLLKAAREAKHVEIRGRTDAQNDNAIDRQIALQRALHARRFLVSNGIAHNKIRWSFMPAGGFIADNKTTEGRAKNRRVEIETMDMDTTAFNDVGQPAKVGSTQ